jgi:glycosyltransferase involved in cell wall biosynthesis
MPKVSIVVPVYNVKDYLVKCVDSLLGQTVEDFEILLVDDGSTDGCAELCDRLTERDPRIRVIHQENKGLGGARNTGIREAKGEWLLLEDSDDWIEPQVLEKTLEAGEREHADMVVFGFRSVNEEGETLRSYVDDMPMNRGLSVKEHKEVLLTPPSAVNKLYRAELFRSTGIQYPNRVWYEDTRTTPKLIAAAERVVFLDYIGYNYLQRQGSIMNNAKIERNVEILDALDDVLTYFSDQGLFEEYRDELEFLTFSHVSMQARMRVAQIDPKNKLLPRFEAYGKEKFPNYMKNKYMSTLNRKQRIVVFLLERRMYRTVALLFKLKG